MIPQMLPCETVARQYCRANCMIACLTRMAAQVGSTNLMNQVTGAMDQKLSGVKGAGILSPVGSKFSMFVGHDENISAISAFLGVLNWQADGFQPNDPGPTGALVFELHKVKFTGEHIVRLFYVIPTLNQMRNGTALTLDTPPQRLPLSIPACGGLYDCPYDQFKFFIASHIRQDCLILAPTP